MYYAPSSTLDKLFFLNSREVLVFFRVEVEKVLQKELSWGMLVNGGFNRARVCLFNF